uniref:Uncharacterized protein n=1 Tax=Setaria italica TaxID=4555 RepID=K4AKZ4_SETIT
MLGGLTLFHQANPRWFRHSCTPAAPPAATIRQLYDATSMRRSHCPARASALPRLDSAPTPVTLGGHCARHRGRASTPVTSTGRRRPWMVAAEMLGAPRHKEIDSSNDRRRSYRVPFPCGDALRIYCHADNTYGIYNEIKDHVLGMARSVALRGDNKKKWSHHRVVAQNVGWM